MFRFAFRLLSLLTLVVAVGAATMDSIESVASSEVVLTSLAAAWTEMSPSSLMLAQQAAEEHLPPAVWQALREWLLPQPAFAAFLALSLLLWMIGYKREHPAGRFAV
ncbi:hypothetical protein J5J10_17400 [Ciceribacter sp. L1K23]|uniref:hypothetical protein n=1 Tax=unclassified Ciceribacter TaxID=2628820 RepID=UPI001ABE2BBD|nr:MULTISPECIES: hypothetical protein [unclassified Ciceribacter]MBO3758580.1 hypothetical protein [Ciceribacter sp. L1K22]MBR0557467.1 hypothetical protein [Ciceribacter sp. L1K23]